MNGPFTRYSKGVDAVKVVPFSHCAGAVSCKRSFSDCEKKKRRTTNDSQKVIFFYCLITQFMEAMSAVSFYSLGVNRPEYILLIASCCKTRTFFFFKKKVKCVLLKKYLKIKCILLSWYLEYIFSVIISHQTSSKFKPEIQGWTLIQ